MKLKLTAALLLISVLLSGCCYAVDRGGADIAPVTAADTEYTGPEDESGVTMVKTESEDGVCEHSWDDWIISTWPTVNNEGRELHYCFICGEREMRSIAKLPDQDFRVELDVENILQLPSLPNGCEVVSLAIVLNYLGYDVNAVEFSDEYLIKGEYGAVNPFYSYVGDPGISGGGMGCYAPCITRTARDYFDDIGDNTYVAADISGAESNVLEDYIDSGIPVILWGTTNMDCDPSVFATFTDGDEEIIWRAHSHCLVLIGYTANTYLFCDPLKYGITEYQKTDVADSRKLVYDQALVIEPRNVPEVPTGADSTDNIL